MLAIVAVSAAVDPGAGVVSVVPNAVVAVIGVSVVVSVAVPVSPAVGVPGSVPNVPAVVAGLSASRAAAAAVSVAAALADIFFDTSPALAATIAAVKVSAVPVAGDLAVPDVALAGPLLSLRLRVRFL